MPSVDQVVADDTHMDEEEDMNPIEKLADVGVGMADIQKLKAMGLATIRAVQMCTTRNLLKIKGFTEARVAKIKESTMKLLPSGFLSGTEFALKRARVFTISTGSTAVNNLLGGGIMSMSITEAFGLTGVDRCVTCQLPTSMGGANGKAAFIDTEGTFRPDRIRSIAQRFGVDPDQVLENIAVARAFHSEHQMELVTELAVRFAEERDYRLLIIDSIIAHFRTDFCGRGELSERQQKLNQMLSRLMKLADEYNVAVFITNQMSSDPGGGLTFVPDPKKPVGGHILAHASTTRLSLRKGLQDTRVMKIYDSPDVPEAECVYTITEGGIADAAE